MSSLVARVAVPMSAAPRLHSVCYCAPSLSVAVERVVASCSMAWAARNDVISATASQDRVFFHRHHQQRTADSNVERDPIDGNGGHQQQRRRSKHDPPTSPQEQAQLAAPLSPSAIRQTNNVWLHPLAANVDPKTIIRAVQDCYTPLYASHPLLIAKKCSLSVVVLAAGTEEEEDVLPPAHALLASSSQYDDFATKRTESYAIEALAVITHREFVASTVGSLTLADGAATMDLTRHIPQFVYWAMKTHAELHDYAKVQTLYEHALAQDDGDDSATTTSSMELLYLEALVASHKFQEALQLYATLNKQKRPIARNFYTTILQVTATTKDNTMALQVLQEMTSKGVAWRAREYISAIESFDDEYVLDHNNKGTNKQKRLRLRPLYTETYAQCLARQITEQETDGSSIQQASRHVVELFDKMVATKGFYPPPKLFLRVVGAAMYLREYETVIKYVTLYERLYGDPTFKLARLATTNEVENGQAPCEEEPRLDRLEAAYAACPESFSAMTYGEFCQNYEPTREPPTETQRLERWPRIDGRGYIKARRQPQAIAKSPRWTPDEENADYCFSEIILRAPWRRLADLPTDDDACIAQSQKFKRSTQSGTHDQIETEPERERQLRLLSALNETSTIHLPQPEWNLCDTNDTVQLSPVLPVPSTLNQISSDCKYSDDEI